MSRRLPARGRTRPRAASVAGLAKRAEAGDLAAGETVVCVLTGHGLKDPDTAIAQCVKPQTVDAELSEIERVIRGALKP